MYFHKRKMFFILVILCCQAFSQTTAYDGIVYPYESQSSVGITNIISNQFISVQTNPARLALYSHPKLSMSMHYEKSMEKFDNDSKYKNVKFSDSDNFPNNLYGVIPFKIFNHNIVLGMSYQRIRKPTFVFGNDIYKIGDIDVNNKRKGSIGNINFGVGASFDNNFSLGLGFTKWVGEWKLSTEDNTDSKFEYNGLSYTVDVLKEYKKVSIGLTLYSPFTLMKSKNVFVASWDDNLQYDEVQYFKGAARLGFIYKIKPQLQIGSGYYLQNDFFIKLEPQVADLSNIKKKYSKSHQLSFSGEYIFACDKFKMPVFIEYQTRQIPEMNETMSYMFDYEKFTINANKDNWTQNFACGFGVQTYSFETNFIAQINKQQVQLYNLPDPHS